MRKERSDKGKKHNYPKTRKATTERKERSDKGKKHNYPATRKRKYSFDARTRKALKKIELIASFEGGTGESAHATNISRVSLFGKTITKQDITALKTGLERGNLEQKELFEYYVEKLKGIGEKNFKAVYSNRLRDRLLSGFYGSNYESDPDLVKDREKFIKQYRSMPIENRIDFMNNGKYQGGYNYNNEEGSDPVEEYVRENGQSWLLQDLIRYCSDKGLPIIV